jgi:endonuclease YncB( thermonuclease family)
MPTEKLKAKQINVVGFCLVLLLPLTVLADTLTGKVVKITDGDTLYVLDANYQQHKIPSL